MTVGKKEYSKQLALWLLYLIKFLPMELFLSLNFYIHCSDKINRKSNDKLTYVQARNRVIESLSRLQLNRKI